MIRLSNIQHEMDVFNDLTEQSRHFKKEHFALFRKLIDFANKRNEDTIYNEDCIVALATEEGDNSPFIALFTRDNQSYIYLEELIEIFTADEFELIRHLCETSRYEVTLMDDSMEPAFSIYG